MFLGRCFLVYIISFLEDLGEPTCLYTFSVGVIDVIHIFC
jgi:hypothetical protein